MDAEAIGASLGLAATIALVIAVVKSFVPDTVTPARWIWPVLALALAVALLGLAATSGQFEGTPLDFVLAVLSVTIEAIGAREATRTTIGDETWRVRVGAGRPPA